MLWFFIVTAAAETAAEISGLEPKFWCKKGDPEQKLAVFPFEYNRQTFSKPYELSKILKEQKCSFIDSKTYSFVLQWKDMDECKPCKGMYL